jgi:integrase
VHGAYEKAVDWQIILRKPAAGVDPPQLNKKPPKVVEKDGVSKLLECARHAPVPAHPSRSVDGRRRGELLALQWPDIYFQTGIISLTKSLEQTKMGLRVNPLNPRS